MKKIIVLFMFFSSLAFAEAPCNDKGQIYKVCSDQKKIFADAEAQAKSENKMLLVVYGADWCPWCRSMNTIFHEPKFAEELAKSYVLAEIGIYNGKAKDPVGQKILDDHKKKQQVDKGIPLLAVTNPKNHKTVFVSTGALEQNTKVTKGHDPNKIVEALNEAKTKVQ